MTSNRIEMSNYDQALHDVLNFIRQIPKDEPLAIDMVKRFIARKHLEKSE